jgi:hypothetical protein
MLGSVRVRENASDCVSFCIFAVKWNNSLVQRNDVPVEVEESLESAFLPEEESPEGVYLRPPWGMASTEEESLEREYL